MLCVAIVSAVGPLGLVLAFRSIVLGRGLRSRWLCGALIACPLIFIGMQLVTHGVPSPTAVEAFDFWAGVLLLGVLPACGALHLFHQRVNIPNVDTSAYQ